MNQNQSVRRIVKATVPPFLVEIYRSSRGKGIKFRGRYENWHEARQNSSGYDSEVILEKVKDATMKVKVGEAACERDSVLFEKVQYPLPVIAVLLRAAIEATDGLKVLDFGGALGSSYYQCRDFLSGVHPLRWHVVEQSAFVDCGRREFAGDVLGFFDTIEEAVADARPNVALLSGVLQCIEKPLDVLESVKNVGPDYVVIDRTPLAINGKQTITVQLVPESIISSSYPIWLFNESVLKQPLLDDYQEIGEFNALDGELGTGYLRAQFKGFIFQRKSKKWSNAR